MQLNEMFGYIVFVPKFQTGFYFRGSYYCLPNSLHPKTKTVPVNFLYDLRIHHYPMNVFETCRFLFS